MKHLVIFLILFGFTSLALSHDNVVYGLWIPKSPSDLLESSDVIFVGNITSVDVLQFEKQSSISITENGIDKNIIENYTLNLDEYTVSVEEFLKNPQNFSIITVREPTVSAAGYASTIGGFQIGDRVLFYVENLDGTNEYSPESFIIPKPCAGKDALTQQRLEFGRESFTIQNGIKVDYGNFTADKPVLFVYNEDVGTLSGKSFDMLVEIAKTVGKHAEAVFSQEIHAKVKPCEWIAHIEWEFTPYEGDYRMSIARKENNTITDQSFTGFSVRSDTATHNPLSPLRQFKSGTPIDKIEFIDGKPFFVSEKYNVTRDPNKIILFHGVTFTHPAFPDPPAPGGGAFTDITFSDGTKETLSQVGLLKSPILFTKHANPQAGMRENQYDTFSLLVSAELTKISPLQQFKAGIPLTEIKCKENLTLLKKTGNELPICVSIKTGQKLLERKFAQTMAVTGPLESMQKSDSYQREITILSISPKNVTLPGHSETPWTEIQIKESIGKSKPLEITNPADGNNIHLAKLTISEVTVHTKYDDNSTGYNTLIFKYSIENVDKDAFYAMPDFEAHFGNRVYQSQMIGDEFSTMLLPSEKKDSSFAVQIGKGANQILLVVKDPATKQTLWSFPVTWHIPSLKNEGNGVLTQE